MSDYIQTEILKSQLKAKYETSHILHLVLTLLTMGWWVIVWVAMTMLNANKRDLIDRRINAAVMNDLAKKT